jgi:hypothetical protein
VVGLDSCPTVRWFGAKSKWSCRPIGLSRGQRFASSAVWYPRWATQDQGRQTQGQSSDQERAMYFNSIDCPPFWKPKLAELVTCGDQGSFSEMISPCAPAGLIAYPVETARGRSASADWNRMSRPGLNMRISHGHPGKYLSVTSLLTYRMADHSGATKAACECTKISFRIPADVICKGDPHIPVCA